MEKCNKNKVIHSLIFKYIERLGVQGIQFIVQLVLARVLLPKDYGVISLITIFIAIANIFVQNGFSTSLIQKKDSDDIDFSSVFYMSILIATLMYIVIYVLAPSIAEFYNEQIIIPVLRVLALSIFFGAFNSVQNAIISKTMQFEKLVRSSLSASAFSGIIGVILAYSGVGVWALVVQQILNQIVITVVLWFTLKWRPKFIFSIKRIKVLFTFGSNMLISGLLDTLYNNLRNIVIGKVYTPNMLGIYNRGQQFPQLIVNNIDGSIQSVMLPTLSEEQENKERIKHIVRRSITTSSFIILPIMLGMAVTAESIVRVLLTDKWISCVPYIRIFCFTYALMPIHTANLQAIKALGHSNIFLKLEIIKKSIGILILFITLNKGVYEIAIGGMISSIISSFINSYPNKKLINYNYTEQIKDILPSIIISTIMSSIVYLINYINITPIFKLIIQLIVGIIIYLSIANIFKIESFNYISITIKEIIFKIKVKGNVS